MANHQSKEVVKKISEDLKIQPESLIPSAMSDKINYSYNVNPPRDNTALGFLSRNTTTAGIKIIDVHDTKDTFLTGIFLNHTTDGANDGTSAFISATMPNGNVETLMNLTKITLVASSQNAYIQFNPPIRVKKGTDVNFGHVFTAGSSNAGMTIYGYEVDNHIEN